MIFGEGPIIKNIAGDLNKLFLQGSRVGQPITNVEGDAAADQGTADLLAAMDPVIQEVAVGMSGEESRHYTVSGTPPLTLTGSVGKPLSSWSVDLLPKQDLNGYNAPWPAGGGRNKLDTHTSSEITQVNNGVTFNLKDDIFTVSNEVTSSYPGVTLVSMGLPNLILPAGTYRLYAFDDTSNYGARLVSADYSTYLQRNSDTTLTEETIFTKLVSGTAMTGVTASGSFKIMVVDTSSGTPTEWSPYSNICPILGTDKLNMFVEESYDPSATPKVVITLPQTVYTGTIGNELGVSSDEAVDMGSLVWVIADPGKYYANVPNKRHDSLTCDVMSSIYKSLVNNATNAGILNIMDDMSITGFYNAQSPNSWVYVRDSRFADLVSFRQAVTGTQLVYKLATPTEFTVTAPAIPTPSGDAVTWVTAEDGTVDSMEVTYIGKA